MSDKPEALRLADVLGQTWEIGGYITEHDMRRAAVELRRLYAALDLAHEAMRDEIAENLRLRGLGGANPDENMTQFIERIIAERDAALEQSLELARAVMCDQVGKA